MIKNILNYVIFIIFIKKKNYFYHNIKLIVIFRLKKDNMIGNLIILSINKNIEHYNNMLI